MATWRKAQELEEKNVTPVFKTVKWEDPGNYRQVSLLSIPERVMEHLILETISRHIKEKKIIKCSQHGFT